MKRAALILGLLFWVATSITVFAQEEQEQKSKLVQLPILLDCGPIQAISELLVEYREIPIAQANVMWQLPSGQLLEGPMTIFAHPTNFTISIVIQATEDFGCIAFPGKDFRPFVSNGTKL
jgi:hypothetical protein